jgi:hypothetical protein
MKRIFRFLPIISHQNPFNCSLAYIRLKEIYFRPNCVNYISVMAWLFQNTEAKGEELRQRVNAGDLRAVVKIVNECRDTMDTTDKDNGWSALMNAAASGKFDIVKWLVQHGADVNLRDPINGWTAVMCATAKSRMDIAIWLIENGANAELVNNGGKSALDIVRNPGKKQMLLDAVQARGDERGGGGRQPGLPQSQLQLQSHSPVAPARIVRRDKINTAAVDGNGPPLTINENSKTVDMNGVSPQQLLQKKLADRKRAQNQAAKKAQVRAQAKANAQAVSTEGAREQKEESKQAAMQRLHHQQRQGIALTVTNRSNNESKTRDTLHTMVTGGDTLSMDKEEARQRMYEAMQRNKGPGKNINQMTSPLVSPSIQSNIPQRTVSSPIPSLSPIPVSEATSALSLSQLSVPSSTPAPISSSSSSSSSSNSPGKTMRDDKNSVKNKLAEYAKNKKVSENASSNNNMTTLSAPSLASAVPSTSPIPHNQPSGMTMSTSTSASASKYPLLSLQTLGSTKDAQRHRTQAYLRNNESNDLDIDSPYSEHDAFSPPGSGQQRASSPLTRQMEITLKENDEGTKTSIEKWVSDLRQGKNVQPPPHPSNTFSKSSDMTGTDANTNTNTNRSQHEITSPDPNSSASRAWAKNLARDEANTMASAAVANRSAEKKKRNDMIIEKTAKSSVEAWVQGLRQGKNTPPPALHHIGIDERKVKSPGVYMQQNMANRSPMGQLQDSGYSNSLPSHPMPMQMQMPIGAAPPGSMEEMKGDIKFLVDALHKQSCEIEQYKSSMAEQEHTIHRLTDELKVIMDKQHKLSEESEKIRVKELNALSIVDTRIEAIKTTFQAHLDGAIAQMHEALVEKLHDQMSSIATDLINQRDESEKLVRNEMIAMKNKYDQEIDQHKKILDQLIASL